MDQRLVVLKARLRRYERAMDDPHGDGSGRDSRPPDGDDYNDVLGEVMEVLEAIEASEAQDEHLPTLEGVISYLEQQNDLAFLAYRRLSGGSEPGMHAAVRARLTGEAFSIWTGVGEALYKAKEAAKNAGPGVTYIDTINRLLDKHFGASK